MESSQISLKYLFLSFPHIVVTAFPVKFGFICNSKLHNHKHQKPKQKVHVL